MQANENINENTIQIFNECIEELEESLHEVINIVQLFESTVESGEEPAYIQRSIHTIEKMLKTICDTDIQRLKATMPKQ